MGTNYRRWKHVLVFPMVLLAVFLMKGEPEQSPRWYTGMIIAVVLGMAYLIEEIFWMVQRHGRPCGHCGQKVKLKSFGVQLRCPHCGQYLE